MRFDQFIHIILGILIPTVFVKLFPAEYLPAVFGKAKEQIKLFSCQIQRDTFQGCLMKIRCFSPVIEIAYWIGINKTPSIIIQIFNFPCRDAAHQAIIRNVLCHHSSGGYNDIAANGYARQNRAISAKPHVIANRHGLCGT